MGRNRVAEDRSIVKERWRCSNEAGESAKGEGQQYSEERRRPKKAEEKADHNMRASAGGYACAR